MAQISPEAGANEYFAVEKDFCGRVWSGECEREREKRSRFYTDLCLYKCISFISSFDATQMYIIEKLYTRTHK